MQRADQLPGIDANLTTRNDPDGPTMEADIQSPSYRSVDVWRIGQYTVLRPIGEGAMGQVFAAYDEGLDRKVAIKMLRSNMRRGAEATARMLREAQALARLSHPNVVQVYEVGKADGQTFIAMEHIAGQDGRAWLSAKPRHWRETLAVFLQAGQGLAAAHRAGLVHRGFKPDNILIGVDGRVCVVDFGLAHSHEAGHDGSLADGTQRPDLAGDVALTAANTILGTPAYMSPEQSRCQPTDARSDQYSFCVTLYEAFFGERPFSGRTVEEFRSGVVRGQMRALPPRSEVPNRSRRVLLRGLALDPGDRWPNMDSLLAALAMRPARRWALGLAGVLVTGATLGALAVGLPQAERCTRADARVAGVWNQARQETVHAAIVGTGLPFAAHAAGRVAQILDGYAADWAAMSTEACQTHQRGEQSDAVFDRRVRCLEHRRADLGAMVEVLQESSKKTVEKAVTAAASLPPMSECADVMALMDKPAPPAELLERIEETNAELGRSRANKSAGNNAIAYEHAERALIQAHAMDYRPLIAEALDEVADAEARAGRYDDAVTHGNEAFQMALAGKQDALAAKIAIRQIWNVASRSNYAVAENWALVARALLEREGFPPDDPKGIAFYINLGGLYARYKPQEAREAFTQALALAEKLALPDWQSWAHGNLGSLLLEIGEPDAGRTHYERALVLDEFQHGADHPVVISARSGVAQALEAVGEPALAEAEYRSALDVCLRSIGPMAFECGDLYNGLANLLTRNGRHAEARPAYERALQISEAYFGPEDPAVALFLANLGYVLLELGEPAEAHPLLTRAVAMKEKAGASESVDSATYLLGLGRAEFDLKRPAVARPMLERVLALQERLEVAPGDLAETCFQLARVLWSAPEDRARAIELGRHAEAVLRGVPHLWLSHTAAVAWLEARGIKVPPNEPTASVE